MNTNRFFGATAFLAILLAAVFNLQVAHAQTPPPPTSGRPGGDRPNFGNFDPAQMQKMMMDGYRRQLEVESDDEWKIIEERVRKVLDARRATGSRSGMGALGGMFGGGFGGPGGGGAMRMPGGENGPFSQFLPPQLPEEESLRKALDNKASKDELKAVLAKLVEARKQKLASLDKAKADLREVLSVRQEATATLIGLL